MNAFKFRMYKIESFGTLNKMNNELVLACVDDNESLALELIDKCTDFDLALCHATLNGNATLVTALINKGANIHTDNDTPLRWACSEYDLDGIYFKVVKILLENGADTESLDGMALQDAVELLNHDIVRQLLEHGANVNSCYQFPIDLAISSGDKEMIKLLVSFGAWHPSLKYKEYRKLFSALHSGKVPKKWIDKNHH